MFNATSAFSMGMGGKTSQAAADHYNNCMNGFYNQLGPMQGWLSGTLEHVKKTHEHFMSSRMWEFSSRIGKDGHFVGRFEIGYLSEVQFQQQATGFMRNYIMANPEMMQLYLDGRVSGYGGDFSDYCSGLGRDNYYYNKAIDGMNRLNEDSNLVRTDYHTSRDNGTHLTVRERIDISRTWAATNLHIAERIFDPSNNAGGEMLTIEEVETLRKEQAENPEA